MVQVQETGIPCNSGGGNSDDTQHTGLQKLLKQVSMFRTCTLCTQRVAYTSLCLPLSVWGEREGPASVTRVCSLNAPSPGPGNCIAPPGGEGGFSLPYATKATKVTMALPW